MNAYTLFYCASLYCTLQVLRFLQIESLGHHTLNKTINSIFSAVSAHFISLLHILVTLNNFSNICIFTLSVMMMCDNSSLLFQFSSVHSLSCVQLFVTPWITARQASLSITNSRSSLKLMSIKSVMPSSHLILFVPFSSCPQSLPASESFPMSQLFAWGGQSIGVSASASVPPMNTQDWSPSEWTGWTSLQSKGRSRVFSNTTVQKHQSLALSFLHNTTLTSIQDHWKHQSLD